MTHKGISLHYIVLIMAGTSYKGMSLGYSILNVAGTSYKGMSLGYNVQIRLAPFIKACL